MIKMLIRIKFHKILLHKRKKNLNSFGKIQIKCFGEVSVVSKLELLQMLALAFQLQSRKQ